MRDHLSVLYDAPSTCARTLLSLQAVGRSPALSSIAASSHRMNEARPPGTFPDHPIAEPGGAGGAASLVLAEGRPAREDGHEDEDEESSSSPQPDDVPVYPPGMDASPTFTCPGENGMCTPLACDCARQPVFTPAVSVRFSLVPELVNNLTDLFVAEHDVFLAGKAQREAEHEGRLYKESATKEELQSIDDACASQQAVVDKALKATSGGLAIIDVEDPDPFAQQRLLVVCACLRARLCTRAVHTRLLVHTRAHMIIRAQEKSLVAHAFACTILLPATLSFCCTRIRECVHLCAQHLLCTTDQRTILVDRSRTCRRHSRRSSR
jgi:hypothetical protein